MMSIISWLFIGVIGFIIAFSAFIVLTACMNASQIDHFFETSMLPEYQSNHTDHEETQFNQTPKTQVYIEDIYEYVNLN